MKTLQFLIIILCIKIDSPECYAQENESNTSLSLSVGVDASTDGKTARPSYEFGYSKTMFKDNMFIGLSMSGKNSLFRHTSDTTTLEYKLYALRSSIGLCIREKKSPIFAGPVIGVEGILFWENFKIDPELPFGGGVWIQVNFNLMKAGKKGKGFTFYDGKEYYIRIFIRSTYQFAQFRGTQEPANDISDTILGVNGKVGIALSF